MLIEIQEKLDYLPDLANIAIEIVQGKKSDYDILVDLSVGEIRVYSKETKEMILLYHDRHLFCNDFEYRSLYFLLDDKSYTIKIDEDKVIIQEWNKVEQKIKRINWEQAMSLYRDFLLTIADEETVNSYYTFKS